MSANSCITFRHFLHFNVSLRWVCIPKKNAQKWKCTSKIGADTAANGRHCPFLQNLIRFIKFCKLWAAPAPVQKALLVLWKAGGAPAAGRRGAPARGSRRPRRPWWSPTSRWSTSTNWQKLRVPFLGGVLRDYEMEQLREKIQLSCL